MNNKKGFSLVELIIVIAIMAILVGVMAPQLIKYIEKTNISSDVQMCDAVRTAIITACSDPEVLAANDFSSAHAASMLSTNSRLDAYSKTTALALAIRDTMGFDVYDVTEQEKRFRSKPAKQNGMLCVYGTGNDVIVYIAHSDSTGQGRDLNPSGDAVFTTDVIKNK